MDIVRINNDLENFIYPQILISLKGIVDKNLTNIYLAKKIINGNTMMTHIKSNKS